MLTATKADRLATDLEECNGLARRTIRLRGEHLGWAEVREDRAWDDDCEGWRYAIETDDDDSATDDYDEARSELARLIRDVRNAVIDERREADEEFARDVVESMIDRGETGKLLAALRAAKLI